MLADIPTLEAELERMATGAFLCRPEALVRAALDLLTPPERISTTECAARFRYIPDPEGSGASLWDPELTPYINGIQDALDDPEVGLVIVPKPGRVGGTIAAENHAFKRLKFGPLADCLWYLPSDSEVDSYVDRSVRPMFELHADLQAKVGKKRSDDKLKRKRIAGRLWEWLQLNRRTITSRTGGFIVGDEIDAANPKLRNTFVDQMKVRGTTLGSRFKGYICSHMDAGWTGGVAKAWKESSRGIWYMPCPHCSGFSSPCPTAPKGRRFVLHYERLSGVSDDEMLDRAAASAGLACPLCGALSEDADKPGMLKAGVWVHEGQSIAEDGTVTGEPRSKRVLGFWIHGTMSPWVSFGDLARRLLSAMLEFERTRKSERLREVTAKVLGEVYEGGAEGKAIDPVKLAQRAAEAPIEEHVEPGLFPPDALFATAAIDVGGSKFDVQVEAWDLENRNWKLERFTIRQRSLPDGRVIDLRPGERIDDWIVLRDHVLRRIIPVMGDPDRGMPIAGVAIDTGGVEGVTWKAREFARRMMRAGETGANGYRLRLIKGGTTPKAPEVGRPREINVDDEGRGVKPTIREFTLNVDKLKALVVERLALDEDGPGYVRFADGLPRSIFEELAGEVLIDGKWERRGANEALDLSAYNEAVRILLQPERADIRWDVKRPEWARPVELDGPAAEDEQPRPAPKKAAPKNNIFERFGALNQTDQER